MSTATKVQRDSALEVKGPQILAILRRRLDHRFTITDILKSLKENPDIPDNRHAVTCAAVRLVNHHDIDLALAPGEKAWGGDGWLIPKPPPEPDEIPTH